MLACEGKASSEAEILSWGEVFGRERRFFDGFGSGRIGAVVANDDGGGGEGLVGKRIEKAEEKIGTKAGGDGRQLLTVVFSFPTVSGWAELA